MNILPPVLALAEPKVTNPGLSRQNGEARVNEEEKTWKQTRTLAAGGIQFGGGSFVKTTSSKRWIRLKVGVAITRWSGLKMPCRDVPVTQFAPIRTARMKATSAATFSALARWNNFERVAK